MARSYFDRDTSWFRIGRFDMGSVGVFCLLVLVGIFVWVVEPVAKPVSWAMAMIGSDVLKGQVWRLVTWPFSGLSLSLWTVLTIVVLWFFGQEVEGMIGRVKMAWMLLAEVVAFAVLDVALTLVLPGANYLLVGPSLLASTVLLLSIAEYPRRPFFFGIPGWIFAAVVIGVSLLLMLGVRDWFGLLHYVLAIAIGALVAKQFGLLSDYAFIPRIARRRQRAMSGFGPRIAHRPGGRTRQATVIDLRDFETQFVASADQARRRLDELLDKVSSQGLSSLTPSERTELESLSKRRR